MKKYVLPIAITTVLAGGLFLGGYKATEALYADAFAEGEASVDAGPDAPPASSLPSTDDPSGAASAVWDLWKSAKIPAVILGLFLLATFIHKKGWLKGRTAFYLATAVSGLTLIAERAAQGDTPSVNMLVTAGMTLALAILKFEFGDKDAA